MRRVALVLVLNVVVDGPAKGTRQVVLQGNQVKNVVEYLQNFGIAIRMNSKGKVLASSFVTVDC